VLLVAYLTGLVATYVQTLQMGRVGRFVLFNLRNLLFTKLQALPLDFFNQNKAGDLISRINNDTDKLNQFFSQALVQVAANLFMMAGAAIFLVTPQRPPRSRPPGAGALALLLARATGGWVKRKNLASLQSTGALSGEIQESMSNFRVIRRVQPRRLFRAAVRRGERAQLRRVDRRRHRQHLADSALRLVLNLAQVVVLAYGST